MYGSSGMVLWGECHWLSLTQFKSSRVVELKFNHSPENAQLELQSSSMRFVATILVLQLQKQEAVSEQENEV